MDSVKSLGENMGKEEIKEYMEKKKEESKIK